MAEVNPPNRERVLLVLNHLRGISDAALIAAMKSNDEELSQAIKILSKFLIIAGGELGGMDRGRLLAIRNDLLQEAVDFLQRDKKP